MSTNQNEASSSHSILYEETDLDKARKAYFHSKNLLKENKLVCRAFDIYDGIVLPDGSIQGKRISVPIAGKHQNPIFHKFKPKTTHSQKELAYLFKRETQKEIFFYETLKEDYVHGFGNVSGYLNRYQKACKAYDKYKNIID